jgi:5-methylcytosine-specific restriction endonuclease McrA
LPQNIEVEVSSQNIHHYKNLGYDIGDMAVVDVRNLPHRSIIEVSVECDFCHCVYKMPWRRYKALRSDYYCCQSCLSSKKKHRDKHGNLTFLDARYRDAEWLRREYIVKNREASDIAAECNINVRTLRWWISHHGLCDKNGSISMSLPFDEILKKYVNEKRTTEEIGAEYGVSGNTIASLLKKNGVELPSRSELLKTYYREKGGLEKAVAIARREENRIRVSCRTRGIQPHEFNGFAKTKQQILRGSCDYEYWRNSVFERDNYTCVACGKTGGDLNAHHILNFSTHEDLRFDIDNGVTLCVKCHNPKYPNSFHAIYGERNNTREQLEEYIRNRRAEQSA